MLEQRGFLDGNTKKTSSWKRSGTVLLPCSQPTGAQEREEALSCQDYGGDAIIFILWNRILQPALKPTSMHGVIPSCPQPHCPPRSPPVPKGLPRRDAEGGVLPDPQDAAVGLIVAEGSIGEVLRVGGHFVQQVHFICMGKRHNQQLSCLRGGALLVALPRRWATAEPPTGCSVLSQASLLKFAHYQQKKWHKGRGMKPLHPSRGGCGTPPRPKQGTAARCELHGEPCITQFPFPSR